MSGLAPNISLLQVEYYYDTLHCKYVQKVFDKNKLWKPIKKMWVTAKLSRQLLFDSQDNLGKIDKLR